jgi:predicted enzyme related to lactoylglutathione lyase
MTVERMKVVYHVVSDVESAAAFYEQGLGLKLKFRDNDRWIQFTGLNVDLAVACPEEGPRDASGAVVVLEVADIDAAVERAVRCGAKEVGRRDMGSHGRTVTIAAPHGEIMQFFQRAGSD